MKHIEFTINNQQVSLLINSSKRLIDVIREDLMLTGTKEGCGEGECGACSVLINDDLVNSCLIPIIQVEHKNITTIEGAKFHSKYFKLCEEFTKQNATQCGFCTPGMILASLALFLKNEKLDEQQIREGISGNLCRCTGYDKIVKAISNTVNEDDINAKG